MDNFESKIMLTIVCSFFIPCLIFCLVCTLKTRFFYLYKVVYLFLSSLMGVTGIGAKKIKVNLVNLIFIIFFVMMSIFLISIAIAVIFPLIRGESGISGLFGPLGDLFNGLLTPILTFLTFVGLLVTILIQNQQMKSTVNELALARDEAKKSSMALRGQVVAAQLQKLDNKFFSLMDNHNKIISESMSKSFYCVLDRKTHSGHIFNVYYEKFASSYYLNKNQYVENWCSVKDDLLSCYLINYNLLSYLDKCVEDQEFSEFDYKAAKKYSNILRATLPNEFLFLIFVNVSLGDFDDYKHIVEKYELLEHMRLDEINFMIFYWLFSSVDVKAFGDKKRLVKYIISNFESTHIFYAFKGLNYHLVNELKIDEEEAVLICNKYKYFVLDNFEIDEIIDNLKLFLYSNGIDFIKIKGFNEKHLIEYRVEK